MNRPFGVSINMILCDRCSLDQLLISAETSELFGMDGHGHGRRTGIFHYPNRCSALSSVKMKLNYL